MPLGRGEAVEVTPVEAVYPRDRGRPAGPGSRCGGLCSVGSPGPRSTAGEGGGRCRRSGSERPCMRSYQGFIALALLCLGAVPS